MIMIGMFSSLSCIANNLEQPIGTQRQLALHAQDGTLSWGPEN